MSRMGKAGRLGRGRGLVSALTVAAASLLMVTGSALATTGHSFADQFGAAGGGAGEFAGGGPSGVAVDQVSGDVLVGDPGHMLGDGVTPAPRVERFDASGAFVSSFAVDGAAYSQVGGIAVGSSGSVYVSALDNSSQVGTVLKYSAAGVFAYALDVGASGTTINAGGPVTVDPVDGTVYTVATNTSSGAIVIDSFDGATGAFIASFDGVDNLAGSFLCPSGLAVDGAHRLYVVDIACFGGGVVYEYSTAGVFGATITDYNTVSAGAVTVDPTTNEVFVGEFPFSGAPPLVQAFTAGGAAPAQVFGPPNIGGFAGLAVNSTTGTVYVADNASTTVERFTTFVGPTVTTTDAVAIDPTSETLNGTINPEGVSSTYRFEYGLDTSYGSQTAESDPVTGSTDLPTTGTATGLLPNTTYHFRIVGSNASGSITGNDQTLITDPAPPTLDGSPAFASAIKTGGATLNGTLNPNGSDTIYRFEYGTDTTYGSSTQDFDAGAGSGEQPVTADLAGLAAGTTYHVRLVADNGTGGVRHGADFTFSTAPVTSVSVDATVFGAVLHGTINPHGSPTTYHFDYGKDTSYGFSTTEADGGAGDGDEPVTQPTSRLTPATTYHLRLVSTANGQTTTSDDQTFTSGAMPGAVATDPTGVTTTAATLGGQVDTYGKTGTFRFFVTALDGSYSTTTDQQPAPSSSSAVTAALLGLPAGESFRVVLSVTSNGATSTSDQIVFSTPAMPTPPGPPPVGPNGPYGCGAPVLNAYNQHPKPGETITITGGDLGVGGTVALGDTQITPSGWSAGGFSIEIPDTAAGTLPLTVNCGHASNTIAVAVYHAPDNRFTITKTTVKGATASLTLKLPGVGKVTTTASHTASKTTTVTMAGTRMVKVTLTKAGKKALNKAKSRKLKVTVRVSYTPAGGTATTLTKSLTFKTGSKR